MLSAFRKGDKMPEKKSDPEAARMKERSVDGSTLKANADKVEEMKFDVLPWEVPLKVVFTDEEPQPLADEGEEADEAPVECAEIGRASCRGRGERSGVA